MKKSHLKFYEKNKELIEKINESLKSDHFEIDISPLSYNPNIIRFLDKTSFNENRLDAWVRIFNECITKNPKIINYIINHFKFVTPWQLYLKGNIIESAILLDITLIQHLPNQYMIVYKIQDRYRTHYNSQMHKLIKNVNNDHKWRKTAERIYKFLQPDISEEINERTENYFRNKLLKKTLSSKIRYIKKNSYSASFSKMMYDFGDITKNTDKKLFWQFLKSYNVQNMRKFKKIMSADQIEYLITKSFNSSCMCETQEQKEKYIRHFGPHAVKNVDCVLNNDIFENFLQNSPKRDLSRLLNLRNVTDKQKMRILDKYGEFINLVRKPSKEMIEKYYTSDSLYTETVKKFIEKTNNDSIRVYLKLKFGNLIG